MTRPQSVFHWAFPAMLVLGALSILLSGRDFTAEAVDLAAQAERSRHPVQAGVQRLVSLFLVLASAERIISHLALRRPVPSPSLLWVFVIFWLGTVAAPSLYGSHPQFSHDYVYALALGLAAGLSGAAERDVVVRTARNALFIFLLLGVLLIPVQPNLVLDTDYSQGLFPGVPRVAGLISHPVTLGMLTVTALLCLWFLPFERKWVNRGAWVLGLAVLFLAQSKTAWLAFILCGACMTAVRHAASFWRRFSDPHNGSFGILACVFFILVVLSVMLVILLGIAQAQIADFFDTPQGAKLATLTGRDQIWAVALQEWQSSWWFGYGPGLWDVPFRISIGMPHATHAHNQYIETLARSGTVGAIALVLYAAVLLVLSLRYAAASGGLSLALFVSLALLSVSEVPLMLFSYGPDLFTHLLLIVTIASTAASRQPQPEAAHAKAPAPDYRTAS